MIRHLLIIILVSTAACAGASACGAEELSALDGLALRFTDAFDLAISTPRASLPPIIADMQAIRRDAQTAGLPPCAQPALGALIIYMDETIDGFQAFLARQPDTVMDGHFSRAVDALTIYNQERTAIAGKT